MGERDTIACCDTESKQESKRRRRKNMAVGSETPVDTTTSRVESTACLSGGIIKRLVCIVALRLSVALTLCFASHHAACPCLLLTSLISIINSLLHSQHPYKPQLPHDARPPPNVTTIVCTSYSCPLWPACRSLRVPTRRGQHVRASRPARTSNETLLKGNAITHHTHTHSAAARPAASTSTCTTSCSRA